MCGIFCFLGPQTKQWQAGFKLMQHRGPDDTEILQITSTVAFGFHRLSINDTTPNGNQPLILDDTYYLICNGEIYNHKELYEKYNIPQSDLISHSDCEVILHLYKKHIPIKTILKELRGPYAFILYNKTLNNMIVARDPIGIRPLYVVYDINDNIYYTSEIKSVNTAQIKSLKHFPPGKFWDSTSLDMNYKPFFTLPNLTIPIDFETPPLEKIYELLTRAVKRRITNTDRDIGFFLSGGFDSSIIAAISNKLLPPTTRIHTFSIGFPDSRDLHHARAVATHINSIHHEYIITLHDALTAIPHVIYSLETFDTTTIRASTPMWMLSRLIKKNHPSITVMLSGEGADEYGSYLYFNNAPSPEEFHKESIKLIKELHLFDVLRADRCTAAHSLELRVPFLDIDFMNYFTSIDPKFRMPHKNLTKYHLRKAFEPHNLLPESVLFREKDAFSDSVGLKWKDYIKIHTSTLYTDENLATSQQTYTHLPPRTKEELWYRELFELHFNSSETSNLLPKFWHPNWQPETLQDPSATLLTPPS